MIRRIARSGRVLLPLLLSLAALAVACGDGGESEPAPTSDAGGGFPRTVVDSSGAEVVIEAPPQRIISYSPAATEILFAIGAGSRVVATDKFSNYPAETSDLPKLEYSSPDPEAALAHEPDLVLFATRQREQVQQFRDLGMTLLFIEEAESIESVFDSIILFGELSGNERQAQSLVASMRERIEAVTRAIDDIEQGPRVFYEITADLYTASPDTFIGSMLSLLKAQNVAAGAESPFPQLSAEAVIEADPQLVLLSDAAFGESPGDGGHATRLGRYLCGARRARPRHRRRHRRPTGPAHRRRHRGDGAPAVPGPLPVARRGRAGGGDPEPG